MPHRRPRGDEFTHSIIGAFYSVYNTFGYGLLESVYANAMTIELRSRGHWVEREVWVDVLYKGHRVARQRLDMVSDRLVILEVKATEQLPPFARRQLLNYLRVTPLELGLILHFGPEPKVYRMVSTKDSPEGCGEDSTLRTYVAWV
jgi:GxxExxY protein